MRTLYLNENRRLVVKRDGPSLWMEDGEKAGRRVPVRLISEVIVRGSVMIDSDALILLVEHGVPVSFINNRVIATALPRDYTSSYLSEKVERLAYSEDGRAKTLEWLSSRRRNFQAMMIKDLFKEASDFIDRKGFREIDYRKYMECLLARDLGKDKVAVVSLVLDGLFHELVLRRVLEIGFDPHLGFLHRHLDFGFVKDLCHILESERDRQLVKFFRSPSVGECLHKSNGRWMINSMGMKKIAISFENHKKKILEYINILLDDFFGILRGGWS